MSLMEACSKCGSDEHDSYTCTIYVDCDQNCMALVEPVSAEELRAALEHWRDHSYLCGCSHGS